LDEAPNYMPFSKIALLFTKIAGEPLLVYQKHFIRPLIVRLSPVNSEESSLGQPGSCVIKFIARGLPRTLKSREERARIVVAMLDDPDLSASEAGLRAGYKTDVSGVAWVRRFNAEGIAGLEDRPRSGRKPTHSQETRSALISLALQKPSSLGYPFELWTLERLQEAFKERQGVHLASSTIWTWMDEEGFEWKRQQSWFHEVEKHDPQFVEKRGPLSRPM
jgi:transposase